MYYNRQFSVIYYRDQWDLLKSSTDFIKGFSGVYNEEVSCSNKEQGKDSRA